MTHQGRLFQLQELNQFAPVRLLSEVVLTVDPTFSCSCEALRWPFRYKQFSPNSQQPSHGRV